MAALPTGPAADLADVLLRRIDGPRGVEGFEAWIAAVRDAVVFLDQRRAPFTMRIRRSGAVALDGGRPQGTVIEIASLDRPFIVTSLTEELRRAGVRVVRLLAVPFGTTRDADGNLASIGPARGASHAEGVIEIELDRQLDEAAAAALLADLGRVVEDVFSVTDDHEAMRALVLAAAERTRRDGAARFAEDEVAESVELVDWLLDGHCVLLGTGRFPVLEGGDGFGPIDETGARGLLRARPGRASSWSERPEPGPRHLLEVARLPELSTVHRQIPIERFDVALVDDRGAIEGVGRLLCVFSRRAEASAVQAVPLLRWKLQRILEDEDAVAGSYDEQAVTSLFQALPKDDLFRADADELRATIRSLRAEDRDHRVRVLMQAEPKARAVSVLLTMPSELYSKSLRERLERFLLAQLDGSRVDVDLSMSGASETVARFLVHVAAGAVVPTDLAAVSQQVRLLCRTWEQDVTLALRDQVGDHGAALALGWSDRLPASYRDTVDPRDAVDDVLILEELANGGAGDGPMRVRLAALPAGAARLAVASAGPAVELSRLLPIVESVGLWVVDELHWDVDGIGLHRLTVRRRDGVALDVAADGDRISDAVLALWDGRAEADSLNRLVTAAAMPWADVAVLRAYRRHRHQIDPRYAEGYMDDVLVANAAIARSIRDLFDARFGPSGADHERVESLTAEIAEACDAVARLDHDRILRGIAGTVSATLRTNVTTRPDGPLALKLDPAAVPDMPEPVPYREIFVHGPAVEGVHLRAGPVARGGLRSSDRPEDYRTEVLDLMRTQVLKNALIVPTGAKGGFVLRGPSLVAGDRAAAVRSAYEAYVGGLLDVTDNIVDDAVVPTPGRWDDDDPYLVVAADKGTAAFSDVANTIAIDRGFWLGDAFASGGSVGYDHRALGITARGAWVAVERHFRELHVDLATMPFTVAGVGDMSGDVFGNAMLLSDHTRLVAVFDHRDIFLDPDPDPAVSLAERRRLQQLAGSSWADYDRSAISAGGGVFSRSTKRIELTAQVRDTLRLAGEVVTPAELMQAILRAPVDLLYLGGIGTYVRASTEADATLDDRSNADVRVSADQLRARVVGEGANLGFTQRARIEYARRGGRINMDAIDNSAGVDTSDHEVNIKILVGLAVDAGMVAPADRPALLESVTDDVVAAVLADSADQSDALRRAQAASGGDLDRFETLQRQLVDAGLLDALLEALPDGADYQARRQAGAGLTRPELGVLLAGAKRQVKAEVLASDLPDSPATGDALLGYFPAPMAERFGSLVGRHRLRRELVASEMANDLIDHLGPATAIDLARASDLGVADVAAAYWISRGVSSSAAWWARLAAAPVTFGDASAVTSDAADPGLVVAGLLQELTRSELTLRRRLLDAGRPHDVAARIAEDQPVFAELGAIIGDLCRPESIRAQRRLAEDLVAAGTERPLAEDLALLPDLVITPDVASIGRRSGQPTAVVAAAFLEMSQTLGIDRLMAAVRAVEVADGWSRRARQGLFHDLAGLRREATSRALGQGPRQATPADGLSLARRWLADRGVEVGRAFGSVVQATTDPAAGLDGLSVAARAIRVAIA